MFKRICNYFTKNNETTKSCKITIIKGLYNSKYDAQLREGTITVYPNGTYIFTSYYGTKWRAQKNSLTEFGIICDESISPFSMTFFSLE